MEWYFFISYKLSANSLKWMAVEHCIDRRPFHGRAHLKCTSLTIKTSTHKNNKQHKWINNYNYLQIQLCGSRRFLLDSCGAQTA